MKAKDLTKNATERYLTHQSYVDQVLGDEAVVSCKMSNIQSKNFKMYTEHIYKRALVNYENKKYWLDSIYSFPFGHLWIAKIEKGIMRIEDSADHLRGTDNYTYKLNVYDASVEKQRRKEKEHQIKESYREKVTKDGHISITNVTLDQLSLVSD